MEAAPPDAVQGGLGLIHLLLESHNIFVVALRGTHMMTDRETLIALLEKMGLEREDVYRSDMPRRSFAVVEETRSVYVGAGDGYAGFYAEFRFDEAGNIISHGIWE